MKNPFAKQRQIVDRPKRHLHDLSHASNFTAKMGYLYPVLVQETLPGESFRISAAAQLNAMPLKFPVQTPINAHFHYFYCRNRNVYKDWEDYITQVREGLEAPYLQLNNDRAKAMLANGELADFLGVPTEVYGEFGNSFKLRMPHQTISGGTTTIYKRPAPCRVIGLDAGKAINGNYTAQTDLIRVGTNINTYLYVDLENFPFTSVDEYLRDNENDYYPNYSQINSYLVYLGRFENQPDSIKVEGSFLYSSNPYGFLLCVCDDTDHIISKHVIVSNTYDREKFILDLSSISVPDGFHKFYAIPLGDGNVQIQGFINLFPPYDLYTTDFPNYSSVGATFSTISGAGSSSTISAVDDRVIDKNPYVGNNALSPLPAYVFRHYEMIYNSFYRDNQNNPLYINGLQQFNEFIPSHDGGADTNTYLLHRRNWELDFLTSALPSPQFGLAPLVGLTVNPTLDTATMEFDVTSQEGIDSSAVTGDIKLTGNVDVKLGDDGETIVGISKYDNNVPPTVVQRLFQSINYGISINDFRNVNAFQRFKEKMVRARSLRYRDQMMAHYGVEPDFSAIDLPSFEGGFTVPIGVRTITQAAQTDVGGSPAYLGDIAGQINVKGSQNNEVQIYSPEHGFIFCIMSITPVPVYSQLLPKYLTKLNPLDYFTPEFAKIGYQPITYREVAPLQTALAEQSLNDVFGYQRPNYDYIRRYDEVHGLLRSNLRDFVINRVFNQRPQLSEDFLLVDPSQVNDVFAVTEENNDTFVCQVYFDFKSRGIVPNTSMSALE